MAAGKPSREASYSDTCCVSSFHRGLTFGRCSRPAADGWAVSSSRVEVSVWGLRSPAPQRASRTAAFASLSPKHPRFSGSAVGSRESFGAWEHEQTPSEYRGRPRHRSRHSPSVFFVSIIREKWGSQPLGSCGKWHHRNTPERFTDNFEGLTVHARTLFVGIAVA